MKYESHAHRFADIILNSDYSLKQEIGEVIRDTSALSQVGDAPLG